MKLISESKIADGSNEAYLKLKYKAYFGNGFQSGVYFAENELKKLAIEFKLFCDKNKTEDTISCDYFTQLLFDKFIEQREK